MPWTGIKANGETINDKPTSISIPPPKLIAVDINEHKRLNAIKNKAP